MGVSVATSADYAELMQSLRPRGPAWVPGDGLDLATADEMSRIHNRAVQLAEESDPRTSDELFHDWERVAGLPDTCSARTLTLGPGLHSVALDKIATFSRAGSATYIDGGLVKAAGVDVPRYEDGRLLIEATRTNLLYPSDMSTHTDLGYVRSTVTGPDGAPNSALRMTEDTSFSQRRLRDTTENPAVFAAGSAITLSCYVRPSGNRTNIALLIGTSNSDSTIQEFNLAAQSVGAGSSGDGTISSAGVSSVGGGWYRCFIALTLSVSITTAGGWVFFSNVTNDGNATYTGDGASYVDVFGMQIEAGSFPSSYIPTTAAAVTRAADACDIYVDATTTERRAALLERLTSLGGQTPAYYVAVAAALGYTITVTTFDVHDVLDDVEAPINGVLWRFVWQVNSAGSGVFELTVADTVADPLASWGSSGLECLINRLKPAHTHVLFAYE